MKKKKTTLIFFGLIVMGMGLIFEGLPKNPPSEVASAAVAPDQFIPSAPIASAKISSSVAADTSGLITAQVTRVVDGDTIEVNLNGQIQKVRYLGMNTPETVDPRRPVQCFGHEASDENKKLVEGKTVILTRDITDTDKYNRLLRFVYLPISDGQMLFVNDYLVREGFAQIYTYPPDVKFAERFLQAQKEAQSQNKGLWGKCKK